MNNCKSQNLKKIREKNNLLITENKTRGTIVKNHPFRDLGNTKLIVITGGVMSGIGKGAVTASIGKILQFRGFNVKPIKIDPYLNIDPGVMNPAEHGEVFVSDQVWNFDAGGLLTESFQLAELDQDFGSYERILDVNTHPSQNITSGQVFLSVISKERKGEYLGRTVQMIPHVTNEVITRILSHVDEDTDVLLIEIGGTVGDIEGNIFYEAVRQLIHHYGKKNIILVETAWVPYLETVLEHKTKPTQHATRELLSRGLVPDIIVCRSTKHIPDHIKQKIANFCNVSKEAVISNPNLSIIYQLPLVFEEQRLGQIIADLLDLKSSLHEREITNRINEWQRIVNKFLNARKTVTIGIAGKYMQNKDTYISVREALSHAAAHHDAKLEIKWIDTDNAIDESIFTQVDGILVPGGFGKRGTENKMKIAWHCFKQKIPYLGICFGMQLALVAIARHACNLENANSVEIDPKTPHPIITLQPLQKTVTFKGGTMRLGAYTAVLKQGSLISKIYGEATRISERHRHRWEVNPEYIPVLEDAGITFSGFSEGDGLVEFIEVSPDIHPFFVGTQAHPEFKSRPNRPHPLYRAFIQAALENKEKKKKSSVVVDH